MQAIRDVGPAARGACADRGDVLPAPVEAFGRHHAKSREPRIEHGEPGAVERRAQRVGGAARERNESSRVVCARTLHRLQPDQRLERLRHAGRVEVAKQLLREMTKRRGEQVADRMAERIPLLPIRVRGVGGVRQERAPSPLLHERLEHVGGNSSNGHDLEDYTHPVGFGNPASLHAPLAGPDGKSA